MTPARRVPYVACVVVGSILTLDAVRQLLFAWHYTAWSIEVAVAVALALVAHRLRVGPSKRRRWGERGPDRDEQRHDER